MHQKGMVKNLKLRIEFDDSLQEEEIIIRCRELSPDIIQLKETLSNTLQKNEVISFYKGDVRIYLSLDEILFFETDQNVVYAHTADDCYEIHHRLYELEELLPSSFMRVSKSTILNTKQIFSIDKNIYASSTVCFRHTHKQVFVSRHYYKPLIAKKEGSYYEWKKWNYCIWIQGLF